MATNQTIRAAKSLVDELRRATDIQVSEDEALRLYKTSQTVYTIATIRGENVASAPLEVVDEDDNPIPDHPLNAIFARGGNYRDVALRTEVTMTTTGRNLNVPNPNFLGQFEAGTENLIWVNPKEYRLDGDNYRGLRGFWISPGMQRRYDLPQKLTPGEGIYFNELDFDNDYDGVAPVEAAFFAGGVEVELFGTQYSYFLNRMLEGMILQPAETGQTILETVGRTLKAFIERLGVGSRNAGRTTVLQNRWEMLNLRSDFTELAAKDLSDSAETAICKPMRFPPELLTFRASNYAQSKEAIRFWKETWLKPRVEWYAEQYAAYFSKLYGVPVRIKPNWTGILEEDPAVRTDMAIKQRNAGFIDTYTAAVLAGVKAPDERLKDVWYFEGIGLLPGKELAKAYLYKLTVAPSVFNSELVTGQPLPQPVDPNQVIPTEQGGVPVEAPQTVDAQLLTDTAKDLDPSLFVALSLKNNPDLMSLQSRLKSACEGIECQWNTPDEFHVTLLYSPSVSDDFALPFLEAVKELPVPEMALKIGSVHTFDNVGEHALHFQIRRNPALLEYQAQLYDLAAEYGIPLSSYSNPATYKPHVTMGYLGQKVPAITFTGKMTVAPDSVYACRGDDEVWRSGDETDELEEAVEESEKSAYVPEDVFKEIEIAARKVSKGSAFVPRLLSENTVTLIRTLIAFEIEQPEIVQAAKTHYLSVTAAKALATTRARFETELTRQFRRAIDEKQKKPTFIRNMIILLDRYARQAYIDGYADGGIEDYELEESDEQWLLGYVDAQEQYVRNIAETLYADEVLTEDELMGKGQLWWNGSVAGAYNEALSRASKDGLGLFVRGDTSDHCDDCTALNGQKRRFSLWVDYFNGKLPPTKATQCGGWRCECRVKPTTGKKSRGALTPLRGASKHDHSHEHEEVHDGQ